MERSLKEHRNKDGKGLRPFSEAELDELEQHLDDETEWDNMDGFWEAWAPRLNDRILILLHMARKNK